MLPRRVYRAGKSFKQRLNDVVGFIAVKKFQVQIAARFVGEGGEILD